MNIQTFEKAIEDVVEKISERTVNDHMTFNPCISCAMNFQCESMCADYKRILVAEISNALSQHCDQNGHDDRRPLIELVREYRQFVKSNREQWSENPMTAGRENPYVKKLSEIDACLARNDAEAV